MRIIIDNRERGLIPIIQSLNKDENFNIQIDVETLDIGDIIIKDGESEKIIIERKTYNDLASSLRDGRYREQSFRLNNVNIHNHNIVYLIEGERHKYSNKYNKVPFSTLLVTMFCIQYYKGFSLYQTRNIVETAEYILKITDKLKREKKRVCYYDSEKSTIIDGDSEKTYTDVVKRAKKGNIRPDNIGEIILSQIPGISVKSSKAIMSHFNSLYDLLNQLKEDKKCLDNIDIVTKNGSTRRIAHSVKNNIIKYLLYQKNEPQITINV